VIDFFVESVQRYAQTHMFFDLEIGVTPAIWVLAPMAGVLAKSKSEWSSDELTIRS
jgi:hypothetical protein